MVGPVRDATLIGGYANRAGSSSTEHDRIAAKDYVLATGVTTSVRTFAQWAFAEVGIELEWRGIGVEECAFDQHGRCIVAVDPRYFRPTEVDLLVGDASKANAQLGWHHGSDIRDLAREMVRADLAILDRTPAAAAG